MKNEHATWTGIACSATSFFARKCQTSTNNRLAIATSAFVRLRQTCILTTTLGDCADDMRSGSNRTLDNMPYWYDNAGNVLVMGERTPGFNGVQTYSYDALDY